MAAARPSVSPGAKVCAIVAEQRRARRGRARHDARAAGRGLDRDEPERLVLARHHHAARAGVGARQPRAIADEGPDADAAGDPQRPRPAAQRVLGRARADQPQRPRVGRARRGLQQPEDPLLARQAPDVEDVVAARDAGPRAERIVQAQAQREARGAPAVGLGVDDGGDRVDGRVGVAQPRAEEGLPGARRARAGRRRRARPSRGGPPPPWPRARGRPRSPAAAPRTDRAGARRRGEALERALQRADAERHPVAVGRGQPQAGQLVAPAAVALARARHDDVVLERTGGARVADLRVEVGADAARALAVEQGDVDNAQMPTILVDPQPRTLDACSTPRRGRGSRRSGDSSCTKAGPDARRDRRGPPADTVAILGQTDLDAERLARAPALRAVVNVEGNFLPNVDYEACFARGIHVLVASPAFAPAVAEAALGMAIDLARGISAADRAMRAGTETYGLEANRGCFLLAGSDVGVVGLGDLGRELLRLLAPFGCRVRAYDPWLPELAIRAAGAEPADLDELLAPRAWSSSSPRPRRTTRRCSAPRARAAAGRRRVPADEPRRRRRLRRARSSSPPPGACGPRSTCCRASPCRPTIRHARVEGLLLSPHRTGGMPEAFQAIGRLAVADLELVLRGLPPVAAGAPSARRSAACAAGRSTSRSDLGDAAPPTPGARRRGARAGGSAAAARAPRAARARGGARAHVGARADPPGRRLPPRPGRAPGGGGAACRLGHSGSSMGRLRSRADRLALGAPAGDRRQPAQDELEVGHREPPDGQERLGHPARAMGREQQALDAAGRVVGRDRLPRPDVDARRAGARRRRARPARRGRRRRRGSSRSSTAPSGSSSSSRAPEQRPFSLVARGEHEDHARGAQQLVEPGGLGARRAMARSGSHGS